MEELAKFLRETRIYVYHRMSVECMTNVEWTIIIFGKCYNVLNNKTIIPLNLAEYPPSLANYGYGIVD